MLSEDEMVVKVIEDLKDGPYACSSLVRLSGGFVNFTYRGTLLSPLPDKSSTVVIKHAEPYLAIMNTWKANVIRSYYEQTMLTALRSFEPTVNSGIHVTTPYLYDYNSITNNQILSDYPNSLELKDYLTKWKVSPTQATRIGIAIGSWLKRFHIWASDDAQRPLREEMRKNEQVVKSKIAINYGRLLPTVELFPNILEENREIFKKIEDIMMEEIGKGEGELIHGDFCTANFVLQNGPIPPESPPLKILVIDWELSQVSSRVFDIGQCLAELYLLSHFRSIDAGAQCIPAFMAGYGPVSEDMAFRIALHFGVHMVVWPVRIKIWGEGEILESCVKMGRDYCVHAYMRDIEFFRGGPLDMLFFPTIDVVPR